MSAGRVLIVEDEPEVRGMLSEYLADHGYAVDVADSGEAMRAALGRGVPDVVLLDVRLPGEDGLTLARWLRERHDLGIIMVTGAGEVVDRIVGLEVGADDYIAKPFDLRELRARLKSVLRRCSKPQEEPAATESGSRHGRLAVGRCMLDPSSRQLYDADGQEIPLTAMEYDLLRVFVDNPGRVLTRDHLLNHTRNREWEPFDRSIDIRIARLRKKIEADPDHPQVIRTVRGAGYMFAGRAA